MNDYEAIIYSQSNAVATIKLNSPTTLNGIKQTMRRELIDVTKRIEADQSIRIVIITGEGKAFCSGADLTEKTPEYANFIEQCEAEYTPWLMAIHNSKKLYIAAVNGPCAGIGTAIAMNCDMMIMAEDAYLYQAFAAIGLMPDGGANWLLVNKIGYARALQLAVEAGRLTAKQAYEYGIANKVVAPEQLLEQAQTWAEKLAQGAPLAQAATKNLMRRVHGMSYEQVIVEESIMQTELTQSEDVKNAVNAFLSKQKPSFKGR